MGHGRCIWQVLAFNLASAGMLAVFMRTAQYHIDRDSYVVLIAKVVLTLPPMLSAAHEASSSHECGCDNPSHHRLAAAKVRRSGCSSPCRCNGGIAATRDERQWHGTCVSWRPPSCWGTRPTLL